MKTKLRQQYLPRQKGNVTCFSNTMQMPLLNATKDCRGRGKKISREAARNTADVSTKGGGCAKEDKHIFKRSESIDTSRKARDR
jgi:hypothetical protein